MNNVATIESLCIQALDAQRAVEAVANGEKAYSYAYEHLHSKFSFVSGLLLKHNCTEKGGWYDPSWWLANPEQLAKLASQLTQFGVVLTPEA